MADPVYAKRPYERAERRRLDIIIKWGGQICHCIPHLQSRGGVHNGGTIGEFLGGVGGGLVEMLM